MTTYTEEEIESILRDYQELARNEILRDEINHYPSQRRLRLASFISHSNGKNRPKRPQGREVVFLVVSSPVHGEFTYPIIRGELRPSRKHSVPTPEELASEILFELQPNERTPENLIERVFDRARKLSKFR